MTLKIKILILGLYSIGLSANALLPSETILLVNTNSLDSLKIAAHFTALRKLPQQNIIYLGLDESQPQISQDQFTKQIWDPVQQELQTRGLDDHVLAWIYSAGFPFRVKTPPCALSITGLTFTRNTVPEWKKIQNNWTNFALSPLFRGPSTNPKMLAQGTGSLDRFKAGLKDKMPIPAMMLGYTGKNGNTVDEVLAALKNGVKGDHTRPSSGVQFVKTDDKHRSIPREWQFSPVQLELAQRGIEATTTTNFPAHATRQWGLMTGAAHVSADKMPEFVPGAMADHMTSYAAMFDKNDQTKCSEWIRAGATATAGTVIEPLSIWYKFPHARFFTHYSRGCTILESFYLSLLNPTQTLCIGEPFCRPWRFAFGVGLVGFPRTPIAEKTTVTALCKPTVPGRPMKYAFFIDGRQVQPESPQASFRIDPTELNDGYHEFCVSAKVDLPVDHGTHALGGFIVNRNNQTPKITGLKELGGQEIAVTFALPTDTAPKKVRLYTGSWLLAETNDIKNAPLSFNEKTIGEGPHTVQIAAIYTDDKEVRSAPLPFSIVFSAQPAAE